MRKSFPYLLPFILAIVSACADNRFHDVDDVAEQYVKLVLAIGEHDEAYVDAYYGPSAWRDEARAESLSLPQIEKRAREARDALRELERPTENMAMLRHDYLARQLDALIGYLGMLDGERMSFDEEALILYDAEPPHFEEAYFERILDEINEIVPGDGPLIDRVEQFRAQFVVPPERLQGIFEAAMKECRARTLRHIPLPANENFSIEYVTDKPWSGYNWYQGDARSLIQMNTELPIHLDRAVHLGCHEGYPGHHTYNVLLEHELVRTRSWPEFSVYALFSPQSLIAEGTANYGVELAFPGNEQLRFEHDVLAPMAGIATDRLGEYAALRERLQQLDYAGNEAARAYLDGEMSREQAVAWLMKFGLHSRERAEQRVRFFDTYRSYVINYNLGRDLVREYVERHATSQEERWQVFRELISSPRLPSALTE